MLISIFYCWITFNAICLLTTWRLFCINANDVDNATKCSRAQSYELRSNRCRVLNPPEHLMKYNQHAASSIHASSRDSFISSSFSFVVYFPLLFSTLQGAFFHSCYPGMTRRCTLTCGARYFRYLTGHLIYSRKHLSNARYRQLNFPFFFFLFNSTSSTV